MDLDATRREFLQARGTAQNAADLERLRVEYLGRNGTLHMIRKRVDLGAMTPEDRRLFGQAFNELKALIQSTIRQTGEELFPHTDADRGIDVTLPGTSSKRGSLHPITLVQMELEDVFYRMGFTVVQGYEVETEYYNFDALNTPADHPARDMQDTYWLTNGKVLRTQTSANQVRTLKRCSLPVRAIFPGRCFRSESVDAGHDNTFYQLEGLYVDTGVSIAHLIAVMNSLLAEVFHHRVTTRLRPGFFPFVEPGFELDTQCIICGGSGCSTCKRKGWVELLPCGLVHPRVLEAGGIDSHRFSGFAFGLGLTRLAMMKYGIPEIRLFNSGDIRFCEQFSAPKSRLRRVSA